MHSGAITVEGGTFEMEIANGMAFYQGSLQNSF